MKLKVDQLVKLERTNPLLIFEDDEVWYELIKKDFDPDFKYQYNSKKHSILQYFKLFIINHTKSGYGMDTETLRNFVHPLVSKNEDGNYRVPCRIIYERYSEELKEKDIRIAAKVREATQRINQEKSKIQITSMNEPKDPYFRLRSKNLENKSGIFAESLKDSQRRRQHFKAVNALSTEKRVIGRVAFGGQAGVQTNNNINKGASIICNTQPKNSNLATALEPSSSHKDSNQVRRQVNGTIPIKRPSSDPSFRKRSKLFGASESHQALHISKKKQPSTQPSQKVYIHER